MKKKIMVLISDGVGLKNFGFSEFEQLLDTRDIKAVYWNSTPTDLENLGLTSKPLSSKTPVIVDVLKSAKIEIELDVFTKQFNSNTYQNYKFKKNSKNFKESIKSLIVRYFKLRFSGKPERVTTKIYKYIRQTKEYSICKQNLICSQPDLVFGTNQRSSNTLAPVIAAQDLKIPTACFIFSWDNLPKATKILDTDYYFVWSKYMKKELLKYYDHITKNQIKIVGTPQFEPHFNLKSIEYNSFKKTYNIKDELIYILFSGDDVTTSPKDEDYLESVCKAVSLLNKNENNKYRVLFRPCPVDFSNRYDRVIDNYKPIITLLKPLWEKKGKSWNTIAPNRKDQKLLANTIKASSLVINLGSSMVFDAACHHKPTAFINFNPKGVNSEEWSVQKIYNYKHFESMPENAVIWLNSKDTIAEKIKQALSQPDVYIQQAKKWFSIINAQPADKASKRIVETIDKIIEKQ